MLPLGTADADRGRFCCWLYLLFLSSLGKLHRAGAYMPVTLNDNADNCGVACIGLYIQNAGNVAGSATPRCRPARPATGPLAQPSS